MSAKYALIANPVFDVELGSCAQAGAEAGKLGQCVASGMDEIIQAWRKVTTSFDEPGSNALVDTAMTSLNDPSESIRDALKKGSKTMSSFVTEVSSLKREQSDLEETREGTQALIRAAVKEKDLAEAERLAGAFNHQVRSMQSRFDRACTAAAQDFSAAEKLLRLDSLPGQGPHDPMRQVQYRPYPRMSWKDFTASLDDAFKKDPSLDQVADRLKGMSPGELKEWMEANPEMVGKLTERSVTPSTFNAGSLEAQIVDAMGQAKQANNYNVDLVGALWASLSEDRRAFLLMAFPAVFGNLNGIPFKDRIRTNKLTVVGEKYRVEQRLAELKRREPKEPVKSESIFADTSRHERQMKQWRLEHSRWSGAVDNAVRSLEGLNKAIEKGYQLIAVSGEGDGRFAVLRGNIHASTKNVAVSVPGTMADGRSLELGVKRIDDMVKGTGAAGIYWQNADLPDGGEDDRNPEWYKVLKTGLDNATSAYNKEGSPKLAAFDAALDRELGGREKVGAKSSGSVRTTYIAHSAGGSMLGTAEAYGLDSTAEVYVAPAGEGTPDLIGKAGGRGNMQAQRYQLQAPEDPIKYAQWVGYPFHGLDPRNGGSGVIDLEAGYVDQENGGARVTTHDGYFASDSTAMLNIQNVIKSDIVLTRQVEWVWVPDEDAPDGKRRVQKELLEQYPERYRGDNWSRWTRVDSLENEEKRN